MSCNCTPSVYGQPGCVSCGDPCCCNKGYLVVTPESVPVQLENLVATLLGQIQYTIQQGRVVWTPPCSLNAGIQGFPRTEGEGLICYLLRVMSSISGDPDFSAYLLKTEAATTYVALLSSGYLRIYPSVTTYTGGVAGAFDAIPTVGVETGSVAFVLGTLYTLTVSAAASNPPGIVSPTDYNGRVWIRSNMDVQALTAATVFATSVALSSGMFLGNSVLPTVSVSAVGNAAVTTTFQTSIIAVLLSAGGVAYDYDLYLPNAAPGGRTLEMDVSLPAAANRVLRVRTNTLGGTVLATFTSDPTVALRAYGKFYLQGAATSWRALNYNYLA